jgi:hypothetical protein
VGVDHGNETEKAMKPELTWRSLVRVTRIGDACFYVVIPGWESNTEIRMKLDDVPNCIKTLVKPGKRFHARLNIQAKSAEELHFSDWEED